MLVQPQPQDPLPGRHLHMAIGQHAFADFDADDVVGAALDRILLTGRFGEERPGLRVLDRSVGAALLDVHLEGSGRDAARSDGEHVVAWDDRGRLLVIDLKSLRIRQELRT